MITTVDPVPADSRFYAVNERIHRFPILKPNALTEVSPRVTCSQPLQTMDSIIKDMWQSRVEIEGYSVAYFVHIAVFEAPYR